MSHLVIHLDDLMQRVQWLFEALSAQNLPAMASLTDAIVSKNESIQAFVSQLREIYEAEERILEVKRQIEDVDNRIIEFAKELGDLESGLYDTATDVSNIKSIDGVDRKGTCSIHDLLVLAERLALVSSAPADFIEHNGVSLCRPPAPLEDLMGASRLHLSVEELLRQGPQDRFEPEVTDIVAKESPSISTSGLRDNLLSDDVPDDWEEDLSDFDYEEVTRTWSEQVKQRQTD